MRSLYQSFPEATDWFIGRKPVAKLKMWVAEKFNTGNIQR